MGSECLLFPNSNIIDRIMFSRLYRSGSNNTTRTVPSKTNEALQDNDIVSLRRRQKSAPARIWRSSRRRFTKKSAKLKAEEKKKDDERKVRR